MITPDKATPPSVMKVYHQVCVSAASFLQSPNSNNTLLLVEPTSHITLFLFVHITQFICNKNILNSFCFEIFNCFVCRKYYLHHLQSSLDKLLKWLWVSCLNVLSTEVVLNSGMTYHYIIALQDKLNNNNNKNPKNFCRSIQNMLFEENILLH